MHFPKPFGNVKKTKGQSKMKKQIMKRTLSVFLSMVMVLLILPVGLLSVSADACTHATKSAWMKYDNTQHIRICACGSRDYANHNWKQSDTLVDGGSGSGGSSDMGDLEFGDVHIPQTGTVSYYCTDCGATTTDTAAVIPHAHTGAWVDAGANHTQECEVCGSVQTENHAWDAGVLIQESTHAVPGKMLHTCTECAATKTELIAVLEGHTWVEVEITDGSLELLPDGTGDSLDWGNLEFNETAPNIPTATKKWVCSDCGALTYVNPLEHECVYDRCEPLDEEYHTYYCACGEVSPEVEQPHTWDDGVVDGDKIVYTCTECNYTKTEDVVVDILWGDANEDGSITLSDATLIALYLATYDYNTNSSPTVVGAGADANGDETITLADAVLVKNYLANYDYNTGSSTIVLGPQKA